MKKRYLIFALIVCLVCVLCVACGNGDDEVPTSEPQTESPTTALCSHEYDNNCDRTCNLCGEIREITHTPEILEAKEATCTAGGLTEGKICSVCGLVLEAQTPTNALGHDTEVIPGYAATCSKTGLTDGEKCKVCGEITIHQQVIMATYKHNLEEVEGTAPGCETTGLTDGERCKDCGYWTKPQGVIAATGHAELVYYDAEPGCDYTGFTGRCKCVICDTVLDEGETIPALGHGYNWGTQWYGREDPTCTEVGYEAGVYCWDCGCWIEGSEEIPALGHDWGKYVSNGDATCIFDGTKTAYCKKCGANDTITDEKTAGHIGEWVYNNDATCAKNGTETTVCTRCNIKTTREVEGSRLEHTLVSVEAKTVTCTEDGWDAYEVCTVCGEKVGYVKHVAPGHNKVAIGEGKPASCTEDGLTAGVKCSVCQLVIEEQAVIAKSGHKNKMVDRVEPTCQADGHTAGIICEYCGTPLVDMQILTKVGHTNVDGKCKYCEVLMPTLADAAKLDKKTNVIIYGMVCQINTAYSSEFNNITVTIVDENGDTFYLYRVKGNLHLGDHIEAIGAIDIYKNKVQLGTGATATVISSETFEEVTIGEALKKADNSCVKITGTVISATSWDTEFNNMSVTIRDAEGNEIYIYRLGTKVSLCDTITLEGVMATYNGSRQISAGSVATIGEKNHIFNEEKKCLEDVKCLCGSEVIAAYGEHIDEDGDNVCDRCEADLNAGGGETGKTYTAEGSIACKDGTSISKNSGKWTIECFAITINQNTSSTEVNYTYNQLRLYKSHKMTIQGDNGQTISSITFTCTSTAYATSLCNSLKGAGYTYTVNNMVVTVEVDSTSFEFVNSDGQVRMKYISISYTE